MKSDLYKTRMLNRERLSSKKISKTEAVQSQLDVPLPPEVPQRRRERLVRALQNWPFSIPKVWEDVLRYHYVQGLHRAWSELGAAAGKGESP